MLKIINITSIVINCKQITIIMIHTVVYLVKVLHVVLQCTKNSFLIFDLYIYTLNQHYI